MLKELLYRGAKAALPPNAAEASLELNIGSDLNWSIQGATKRTTDECGRGMGGNIDGLIHRSNFSDRYALVYTI
jgi:hypothetical protein